MPPRDKKLLEKMKKLFLEGLAEAEKHPDKYMYLKREQLQRMKPWNKLLKDWDPKKKEKAKDREAAVRVASRFAAQADLDDVTDGLADLQTLSDNLTEIEDAFDTHFKG